MKWMTNTYLPKNKDEFSLIDERPDDKTWLIGKIIDRPQATSTYTVEQLEKMGYVGVYLPD